MESPGCQETRPDKKPSLYRIAAAFLLVVAVLVLGFLSLLAAVNALRERNRLRRVEHPETGFKFPESEELVGVHVRSESPDAAFDDFLLPPVHWDAIRTSLTPSQLDQQPAAWQALAEMDVHMRNGVVMQVEVYSVGDERVGAFVVDSTPGRRTYYRGGNTRAFLDAVLAARQDAKE